MKRLILILLAAIMTANIFAVDFTAQIVGSINLISGNTDNSNPNADIVFMGGNETGRIRLEAQMQNENFGAWARLNAAITDHGIISGAGYLFYRPNSYLDFFITYKPPNNGHWALDGNALGSFYGFSREVIVTDYHSYGGSFTAQIPGFDNAFYSGFTNGAFLTVRTPLEGLGLNLGLPVFSRDTFVNMIQSFTIQASYAISDFGHIGFTFEFGANDTAVWDDSSVMYAYFNLSKIKNAEFDLGFGYRFKEENASGSQVRNYPLNFGFTASFDNDKFDFKLRFLLSGFGSVTAGGNTADSPIDILADLLPSIQFTENFTLFINAGIDLRLIESADTVFLWHLNPYVVFGNMDAAAFYAGLRLDNRGGNTRYMYWSVPIGISINLRNTAGYSRLRR